MNVLRGACVVLAVMIGACTRAKCPAARKPIDDKVMAVLTSASARHHKADSLEALGRYDEARASVAGVIEMDIPREIAERTDIRMDAWARLGEIDLARGVANQAIEDAQHGLEEGVQDSVMRARLLEVKGRALNAQAVVFDKDGKADEARRYRERALDAFDQSILMNQRVLGLPNGTESAPR